MTSGSFAAWKDKIAWGLVCFIGTSAAAFGWWATTEIYKRPTTGQVEAMIRVQAPYNEDRKWIKETIQRDAAAAQELAEVINRNTEAINQLRVQIAGMKRN